MSSIDDLLYAPIDPYAGVDFLVRKNVKANYDWKPISDRAIAWIARNFTASKDWRFNFSSFPDARRDQHTAPCLEELIENNYRFLEVPPETVDETG